MVLKIVIYLEISFILGNPLTYLVFKYWPSMKQAFLAIIALTLFVACNPSTESKKDFTPLTFSMDTVIIDSKGEFLFLNWGLSTATVSNDGKVLYNLNIQEPSLEAIDLDKLELLSMQVFDKEGPNGIENKGRGGIVYLGEDTIFFKGWPSPEIFNTKGQKLAALRNFTDIKTKVTDKGKNFMYEAVIPTDPHHVYGIVNEFPGKNFEFGRINLKDCTLKTYPLPTWGKFDDFTITYDDGQTYHIFGPYIYVENINRHIIVSSNFSSELFVYKSDSDSLHHLTYSYNLTKSEKAGGYPTEISDPKEYHNIFKRLNSEVSFHSPIWDNEKQQYYRIHYENFYEDDFSEMYPKMLGAKVYLSIYDKEFNLIGEGKLPTFKDHPGFHFVKDGKIWMFKNIGDEMGFVRLSFMP